MKNNRLILLVSFGSVAVIVLFLIGIFLPKTFSFQSSKKGFMNLKEYKGNSEDAPAVLKWKESFMYKR